MCYLVFKNKCTKKSKYPGHLERINLQLTQTLIKKIRPKDPPTKSELLLTKFELKTVNTSQEDWDQIHNL